MKARDLYRRIACALARKLLASEYLMQGSAESVALHNANARIQELKRENSRLSIMNTRLKVRFWMFRF